MIDQFMRLPDVVKHVGLSKSELYRQIAAGRFPAPRPYRDNPKKRFWLQSEVEMWQVAQIHADLLG